MAEEARVDVAGLNHPPAQGTVEGGDADDWGRELDDAPAPPPAVPAEENLAPPPPPSDGVSELRSDLQALQLEPSASAHDSEMDVQKEEELVEKGKRHLNAVFIGHVAKPVPAVYEFNAQLQILELLDNAIFTAGYKAVLHIHSVVEECEIVDLIQEIDTKKKSADPKKKPKRKPLFVKNGAVVVCRIQVNNLICIETFSDFAQLGRFTLRTEGKTIAIGKVVDLPPSGSATFSA